MRVNGSIKLFVIRYHELHVIYLNITAAAVVASLIFFSSFCLVNRKFSLIRTLGGKDDLLNFYSCSLKILLQFVSKIFHGFLMYGFGYFGTCFLTHFYPFLFYF